MKKWIKLLCCAVMIFMITGCVNSSTSDRVDSQGLTVADLLEEDTETEENVVETTDAKDESDEGVTEVKESETVQEDSEEDAEAKDETEVDDDADVDYEAIDVDLTILPSNMVYSEVYNMMYTPEDYMGKTIKMEGLFTVFHDESTGNTYFACIVTDATACCSQGIEFVLAGDYIYPDDYPEEGSGICVVGVFDTYIEGDYRYCTLRKAKLVPFD